LLAEEITESLEAIQTKYQGKDYAAVRVDLE